MQDKLLFKGVFQLKDTHGLPLDMIFELVKEAGYSIDYCDLLCNAWLNDCLKFEGIVRELEMLGGSHVEEWKLCCAILIERHPEIAQAANPIDECCKRLLSLK